VAIAFDAAFTDDYATDSGAGTTFSWTHTPVGTPRGILVFCHTGAQASSQTVTGVTYSGVTMAAAGSANLTAGENGNVTGWFLGESVPTGAQTVTVTILTDGGSNIYGTSISLTAAADTSVLGTNNSINSSSSANPSSTLALGSVSAFVAMAFRSGQGAVSGITPLTNWTDILEVDDGAETGGTYRYNIIGSTDVTVGWTQTADDAVALAVAIREGAPKTITAGAGSYAITGTAATPKLARKIAADAGSYAVTGATASFSRGQSVVAGAASYAIGGADASLKHGKAVVAGGGSYAVTGTNAALLLRRIILAESGSYEIAGSVAGLGLGKRIAADGGSYAVSGTDAGIRGARVVAGAAGSYAVTGSDAGLVHNTDRVIAAGAGSYQVIGTDAALIATGGGQGDADLYVGFHRDLGRFMH